MLTVHHLGKSQSERIVWLCEELEIPYELKCYTRDPVTMLAPPDYKALHPIGAAPVITDGDLVLAESGAVVDYIIAKYGNGRLALAPDHPDFAHYLYWFHFANGTLQANMGRNMILNRLNLPTTIRCCSRDARPGSTAPSIWSRRARRGRISGRQRIHGGRHHDGLFADHDALFPALRSRALSRTSSAISRASARARPIAGRWKRAIRGWRSSDLSGCSPSWPGLSPSTSFPCR